MFVLLNGALGIGKTAAACALLRQVTDSRLYDPEPVGVGLQRLSAVLRPRGASRTSRTWRRGGGSRLGVCAGVIEAVRC